MEPDTDSILNQLFHPAVAAWFRRAKGTPTPAQSLGWPQISSGRNCLIFSPTGSGKTLAAFLSGIDALLRARLAGEKLGGVRILYISPLKALNYDIERNLREPLEGIGDELRRMGLEPPEITVGVRTGDTPSRERARMARKPPLILITTPESLNLILTSRAASMLRNVRQVILDEVHSLAPNKRGAFLSVLLERMEGLTRRPPVRIGLSATQRPLEVTARFVGGFGPDGQPRPVEIVDASLRKGLDVTVSTALPDLRRMEQGTLWPALEEKLLRDIQSHRSTIVFGNNRRTIERLTLELNDLSGARIVEPHHGSISATRRKETEERLKRGDIRAVAATSTLELGIDMGAVDQVCQVQSPKTVSGALQRVGRAGHLYGGTSKGRIYATSLPDLMEAVVISRLMRDGRVEEIHLVENALDVLAQQIAAMAAHGPVSCPAILATVRRSACFYNLPEESFRRTVEMVAGRMGRQFPARVSLDRIADTVSPLPGTLRSVVSGGGVIPDTGQFPVYLSGTRLSVGELDEEFVWEAREGEAFRLGTSLWRIEKIEADRVFVHPTAGVPAKVPFWRGDMVGRDCTVGEEIGKFLGKAEQTEGRDALERLIISETAADADAARNLAGFIIRQREAGALPTDRRVVVERFQDQVGEGRLAVITPFGARVHQALRIALVEEVRRISGAAPESMATDNGVLIRLPEGCEAGAELLMGITPARFEELLNQGLAGSPLFGLRFRLNAGRSLLLPGTLPGRRNPLWLQRLKAKDLLQIARAIPGFPVVAETARECREDVLDTRRAARLLADIQAGRVEVSESSSPVPSPFAASLEFLFNGEFMYVWDRPVGEALKPAAAADSQAAALLAGGQGIDPAAVDRLREDAQHTSEHSRARTAAELAEVIRRVGPLSAEEAARRSEGQGLSLLEDLAASGRVCQVDVAGQTRWALSEEADQWRAALADPAANEDFWRSHAPDFVAASPGAMPEDFAIRFGLDQGLALRAFAEMEARGVAVQVGSGWLDSSLLEAARRLTLAIRRQEASPVGLEDFQAFLFRWQRLQGAGADEGPEGVADVLEQLAGAEAPAALWEADILARRVHGYRTDWLDTVLARGRGCWRGIPGTGHPGSITFLPRGLSGALPLSGGEPAAPQGLPGEVLRFLRENGASFLVDIGLGLRDDTRKVEEALRGLAWMGLVSQDGFDAVRTRQRSPGSASEAARKTRGAPRQRYMQLRRLRPPLAPPDAGRWFATGFPASGGADEESVELWARLLLDRCGVAARDIAAAANVPFAWGALYRVLERMELAGEIERGWYVRDLGGAQFALREAAGQLRQSSRAQEEPLLISTCDPALVTPGPWTRRAGNYLAFLGGRPVLLVESGAHRLRPLGPEADALRALPALKSLFDHPWPLRPVRRLEVLYWGEREAPDSAVESELRAQGFERTSRGLILRSLA